MNSRVFNSQDEVDEARRSAVIDVLPTDLFRGETAAFDVVVTGMGLVGRWRQKNGEGGAVIWTTGGTFQTGECDLDPTKIAAAVRPTIPYRLEDRSPARLRLLDRLRPGDGNGEGERQS